MHKTDVFRLCTITAGPRLFGADRLYGNYFRNSVTGLPSASGSDVPSSTA